MQVSKNLGLYRHIPRDMRMVVCIHWYVCMYVCIATDPPMPEGSDTERGVKVVNSSEIPRGGQGFQL